MTTGDATIRRYLLGETSEAENEGIERACLAGEEALEAAVECEEDLIADYLAGRLPAADRARFESHYLASPVHRRRVAIVRGLAERTPARRTTWTTQLLPLAAALLVVTLGGFWWYRGGTPGPDGTVSVTLPAVLVREGGETPPARIGPGTRALALRFEDGGAPATPPFEAIVRTVEGGEVWRGPAAAFEGPQDAPARIVATAEVPAERLPDGDYVVVLSSVGEEPREVQRYYLRVLRR